MIQLINYYSLNSSFDQGDDDEEYRFLISEPKSVT